MDADADVRAVLAREFPERTVTAAWPAARGNRKRTVLVDFGGSEASDASTGTDADADADPRRDGVVVQFGPAPALHTETAVARAVRERTPVPVPRVLAEGCLESDPERGYAVVERAPGVDLHERFAALDPDARADVAATFGRYLAAIHDAFVGAFDAYGPVVADDALVATGPDAWPAWVRGYAAEGIAALPDAFEDLRGPLERVVDDASLPARPPATLYPWDLRPGNALYGDGAVTAVLDWGEPLAARPALSVAKTEHLVADWYVDDPSLRGAFREGYRTVRPLPNVTRLHRLVAVVRSAVDSQGTVTRPRYPELTGEDAVAFHRERLIELL